MLWRKKKKKKKKKTLLGPYLNTFDCIILWIWQARTKKNQGTEENISGSSPVLISGRKGVLISHGGLCEATKHLDCNSLMIHNGIRNKMHMYNGYTAICH